MSNILWLTQNSHENNNVYNNINVKIHEKYKDYFT